MHKSFSKSALLIAGIVLSLGAARPAAEPQYKLLKEIPIGGGSGWDYLAAEPTNHRLYVTHRPRSSSSTPRPTKIIGTILDTPGVHASSPCRSQEGLLQQRPGEQGQRRRPRFPQDAREDPHRRQP